MRQEEYYHLLHEQVNRDVHSKFFLSYANISMSAFILLLGIQLVKIKKGRKKMSVNGILVIL